MAFFSYKQNDVLIAHNDAVTSGRVMFVAQDYQYNGATKKRYTAFTGGPAEYFAATRNRRPTNDYELIPAHRPVKLYLDVEREFDRGTSDGERWARQVQADLTRLLFEFLDETFSGWREDQDSKPELLWMSASSDHKLSLHGILNGVHFLGVHVVKAVVNAFVAAKVTTSKLDGLIYADSVGKSVTVIDDKVYTRNRCFRLPYAQKLANQDPKRVLIPELEIDPADYLVTILPSHSKLLRWPGDHTIETSNWTPFELFLKLTPPGICRSIGKCFVHDPKSPVPSDYIRVAWLNKSDHKLTDLQLENEPRVLECNFEFPTAEWFNRWLPYAIEFPGVYHWCAIFHYGAVGESICRLAVDIDGFPEATARWEDIVAHLQDSVRALNRRPALDSDPGAAPAGTSRAASNESPGAVGPLDVSCALLENPLKPGHGHLYFPRIILYEEERRPLLRELHRRFMMRWPDAPASFDPDYDILRFWGCIKRDPRGALQLTRWWGNDGNERPLQPGGGAGQCVFSLLFLF